MGSEIDPYERIDLLYHSHWENQDGLKSTIGNLDSSDTKHELNRLADEEQYDEITKRVYPD
ncbi:hypothetical protein AB7C87_18400 [Natrarchaeobius sp. A-rgal3]|uniref:hypothetical protein n=1 Tax=Natrarchaeobius versutus TaxID=1679078 RepID=UPI00350EEEC7